MVAYRIDKLRQLGILWGTWLDLGCADGGYAAALLDAGVERVVGVDIEPDRIAAAEARAIPNTRFLVAPSEELPFPDESFDGVLLNEVLEHVTDEQATLRQVRRLVRAGGVLALMSPNRWFPFEGHGAQIGPWQLGFPVPLLPYLPKRLGQRFMHARNYWPRELLSLVADTGFLVERVEFILPMFQQVPWMPRPLVGTYLRAVPTLERIPGLRQLAGVSTLVVARAPVDA
jgi:SAM-dependent methyltransferase